MKRLLTEKSVTDLPVRTIVRQIINIVKSGNYGEYFIPEDIKGYHNVEYHFKGIPYFSIELNYNTDNTLDDYKLDGALLNDNSTISIELLVNPTKYPEFLYDLIADINDIVRHEIEHIYQENWMRPEDEIDNGDPDEEPKYGMDYYKQKHEVPAQIKGFRRIIKLRKESPEKIIKDWFIRNKEIHNLDDLDIDNITNYLTKKYKEYYG